MKSIFVLGEALIDCIEHADGQLKPVLGGSPFNLARAAALQGATVTYLNRLSDDAYGGQFVERLEADSVGHDSIRSGAPTSLAVVRVRNGQPDYSFYRDGIADRDYTVDSILDTLKGYPPGILHTGSLALLPPDHTNVLGIIAGAKQLGWTISVDVNLRPRVAKNLVEYVNAVHEIVAQADWIKASDEDLEILGFGNPSLKSSVAIASAWQGNGASRVALTFGRDGASLFVGAAHAMSGAPAVEVVDSVGAGDTFWGSCVADWATEPEGAEQRVSTTLQRAIWAAAINCEREGCQPPRLQEVLQNQVLEKP